MIPFRVTTPDRYLLPDPAHLRDLADWLDETQKPDMATVVRKAAADLEHDVSQTVRVPHPAS